jgi:hypothetical protein
MASRLGDGKDGSYGIPRMASVGGVLICFPELCGFTAVVDDQ